MDTSLTLDMIYELPLKVIKESKEKGEFASMISENICDKYNINDIKAKITLMFAKFNSIKFYYNMPLSKTIRITPEYKEKPLFKNEMRSKIDIAVSKKIDNMIWASEFYKSIIKLSKGLTYEEAYYLSYGLIACRSHEKIAEDLNISIRSIQPIKKSCLVKIWAALEIFYEED